MATHSHTGHQRRKHAESEPPLLRRGARHPSLVPESVLRDLETGGVSVNHMEQIALNMSVLLRTQFPSLAAQAHELGGGGLVHRMRRGGEILWADLGMAGIDAVLEASSDTVRGWGAMAVACVPGLQWSARLRLIRPFADDDHFAVREWAWLSMRPHVVADVSGAVSALAAWTHDESPRVRRFVSEVTRPRGVWSRHIAVLKENPAQGASLLLPLRSDASRYVQTSVANWLNDASKSDPRWVRATCTRWLSESPSEATAWICTRALRTVNRQHGL